MSGLDDARRDAEYWRVEAKDQQHRADNYLAERDKARSEVERLRAERDQLFRVIDDYREMLRHATQKEPR